MYVVKEGTSTQAWLSTVKVCPCCHSQQPKDGFKHVDGMDMCSECQEEHTELLAA